MIPRPSAIRQTFTNKEQEGRLEVQLMPFNARFAAVTTAFGLQAGHQELTAPSPIIPARLFNGLWDPNNNTRVAGYVFNEFKFSDHDQGPDRRPHRARRSARHDAGNFPADFLPDGNPQAGHRTRTRPSRRRAAASA